MSASTSSEFARAMAPVARALKGEPNKAMSSKEELRFGTNGSLSVDVREGIWADHETNEGGGLIQFVQREKRCDKEAALDYLVKAGHISPPDSDKAIVASYTYVDESGLVLSRVVRKLPKTFLQNRSDGQGGWIASKGCMAGVRRVLYRLPSLAPAIAATRTIYVVEGEKAVHAMESLGLVATCSPQGAGKWRSSYSPSLTGADVVLVPDNDDVGRLHVQQVAAALAGIASRLRVLTLPGLPEKGDVFDWVAAGGTRKALEALVPTEVWESSQHASIEAASKLHLSGEVQTKEGADAVGVATDRDFAAEIHAVIERMNAKFAVVNEGGKAVIFQDGYDAVLERHRIERLAPADLLTLYQNDSIQIGVDDKNRPVFKPVARLWLGHKKRRQFIDGVTFDPTTTASRPGILNLWRGFAVKPKAGDWSLLRNHIRDVICSGVKAHDAYLIRYMARMVQFPGKQGETAVVMKGKEGCGKGTPARVLLKIMGQHGLAISNAKHLVGNFNGHLRDAVMLFADEAFFAGDRAHVGVLKSLITEPYLTVEAKFQNAVQMPNFLHCFMASNEKWVVPASLEARRFFVLDVPDTVIGDFPYFEAIWHQMDNGGYEAMLHDLLRLDLTHFNVRSVPASDALQEQRKLSLPVPESWWKECLERGYVFRSKLGLHDIFGTWHDVMSTELLEISYLEFAKSRGERDLMSREYLGRFVKRMGGTASRPKNGIGGEHMTDEDTAFGGSRKVARPINLANPPSYKLGSLADAREAFTSTTSLKVEWETELSFPQAAD